MAASKSQQVQELKDKGNEAVKGGNYTEAIIHYTYALKLDPSQYQLHSNRSLAFLKLQQYYHALEDANETIRLKPDWAKGYFRKAEVEFHAEQYEDALQSYRMAFQLEPSNMTLLEAIKKTAEEMTKERKREILIPWIGASLGFIIGGLIVVGDYVAANTPMLTHPILKVSVILVMTGVCYFIARLHRYYMQMQRNSLLEPPIDLLDDDDDDDKKESNNETKKSEEKHRSKAAARQRFKKGKR